MNSEQREPMNRAQVAAVLTRIDAILAFLKAEEEALKTEIRSRRKRIGGETIKAIALDDELFSCWCALEPKRRTSRYGFEFWIRKNCSVIGASRRGKWKRYEQESEPLTTNRNRST